MGKGNIQNLEKYLIIIVKSGIGVLGKGYVSNVARGIYTKVILARLSKGNFFKPFN
jgi:hypothetical protein